MAKNSITDYDNTSGNNTDVQSVDISEGCSPSGINNAIREVMADLADVNDGTVALTSPQAANMTVTGTVTTDTIAENTSAAGVTIDGVLLKDGGVGSATAAIAAYLSSINGGQIGGNRNLIINGSQTIAQRGTSTTGIGNGGFITDRFFYDRSGLGVTAVFDASQSTDAPSGFQYSAKLDCTTAQTLGASGGTYLGIRHKIEGYNVSHLTQNSFTLSFYVKSTKTGTFSVVLKNSGADRFYCAEYTVSASDTWERKDIQIDAIPSAGTWNFTNGVGLDIFWCIAVAGDVDTSTLDAWTSGTMPFGSSNNVEGADSTSNNFLITGVQLELGEATSFEHRSYGDELARCQRYYYRRSSGGTNDGFLQGGSEGTGTFAGVYTFPVSMRASPSYSSANATNYFFVYNGSSVNFSTLSGYVLQSTDSCLLYESTFGSSLTSNSAYSCRFGNASAYIDFEAEL